MATRHDHASIATEVKIIEQLKEEGIEKQDLGEGSLKEHGNERRIWWQDYILKLKKLVLHVMYVEIHHG